MAETQAFDLLVNRNDLSELRFDPATPDDEAALADGEALVAVDRFALTANNLTYALLGESVRYWDFFPAEPGWGRLPAWGFGQVLRSRHDEAPVGQRLYGFWPMSSSAVLRPERIGDTLVDVSEHRRGLPGIYNSYLPTSTDPFYDRATEDQQMLLRPLFSTAFLLDDHLVGNDLFGADAIVLTSASSKTAFSLAALLAARGTARVVGLTSVRNAPFVEGLGCYDEVVTYDELSSLDPSRPTAIVDVAGNLEVLVALHRHLGEQVRRSALVGMAHRSDEPSGSASPAGLPDDLPGARPELFFAPSYGQQRAGELGLEVLQDRLVRAWHEFVTTSEGWIEVVHGRGGAEVERIYHAVREGRFPPDQGAILSLR